MSSRPGTPVRARSGPSPSPEGLAPAATGRRYHAGRAPRGQTGPRAGGSPSGTHGHPDRSYGAWFAPPPASAGVGVGDSSPSAPAAASGSSTMARVPRPTWLSSRSSPPNPFTSPRDADRPRPVHSG